MDVRDDKAIETSESSETPKEKAQEMHTTAVVCGIWTKPSPALLPPYCQESGGSIVSHRPDRLSCRSDIHVSWQKTV